MHKLVPTWRVGKRTLGDAKKFVKSLKSKHDSHLPFFTSDDLPQYADALLDIYGETSTPRAREHEGGCLFRANDRRPICAMPWL